MSFNPATFDRLLFRNYEEADGLLSRAVVERAASRLQDFSRSQQTGAGLLGSTTVLVRDKPTVDAAVYPQEKDGPSPRLIVLLNAGLVYKVAALARIVCDEQLRMPEVFRKPVRDRTFGDALTIGPSDDLFSDSTLDCMGLLDALRARPKTIKPAGTR